jgi:hypothetical protein
LLVEQGLLTDDELEQALATQQQTGERLGETIVKCGFVSGPELAAALAAQYGIELTTEKGFGTGLRSEIQRRHENDRRRIVQIVPDPPARLELVPDAPAPAPEPELEPELEAAPTGEAMLLAQLEEQWAKLAAAEEALAERERELAGLAERRDRDLEELAERALELTERAESRERELAELNQSRERELAELAEGHERVLAELAERERELIELTEQRDRERVELAEHDEREQAALTETREHELAEVAESHRREIAQLEEVNERLREQLEELRQAQVAAEEQEPTPLLPTSHLVFVQLDERYELISRDGPPPEPFTPLYLPDVDEGSFVVAGSRRSPFPGDARPCVVALRG